MILSDGTEITRETAAHKFGGDPMAEYLYLAALESAQDEDSGTVDGFGLWFARFGRRMVSEDSLGFVESARFASEAEAVARFAELDAEYGEWLGDDGECEILVEVDGVASGECIGTCPADGRPIFRSHMAGTIYHASADR